MTNWTPATPVNWDTAAQTKSPLRAAWDEDTDLTDSFLAEILPYMPHKGILVDLGCGPGRLTAPVATSRPDCFVIGIDSSPEMLRNAPDRPNLRYDICDGMSLGLDIDIHAAWSVLMFQHVSEHTAKLYLRDMARWLKPDGIFRFQYVEDGGDLFRGMAARWRNWCQEAGLVVENVQYNGITKGWTWITARR